METGWRAPVEGLSASQYGQVPSRSQRSAEAFLRGNHYDLFKNTFSKPIK